MRKMITLAALAATLVTTAADAKQWTWRALDVKGGTVAEIATGAACNYATAISQARKAGAPAAEPAFTLAAVDNAEACPAKPKATTAAANG